MLWRSHELLHWPFLLFHSHSGWSLQLFSVVKRYGHWLTHELAHRDALALRLRRDERALARAHLADAVPLAVAVVVARDGRLVQCTL